jgi:hypothetical protein
VQVPTYCVCEFPVPNIRTATWSACAFPDGCASDGRSWQRTEGNLYVCVRGGDRVGTDHAFLYILPGHGKPVGSDSNPQM